MITNIRPDLYDPAYQSNQDYIATTVYDSGTPLVTAAQQVRESTPEEVEAFVQAVIESPGLKRKREELRIGLNASFSLKFNPSVDRLACVPRFPTTNNEGTNIAIRIKDKWFTFFDVKDAANFRSNLNYDAIIPILVRCGFTPVPLVMGLLNNNSSPFSREVKRFIQHPDAQPNYFPMLMYWETVLSAYKAYQERTGRSVQEDINFISSFIKALAHNPINR